MKRSVTQNKQINKIYTYNTHLQELQDMEPRIGLSRYSPAHRVSKKPSLFNMTDRFIEQKEQMKKDRSYNILQELDRRDPMHSHKYKKMELHSKASDLQEIRTIIEELLNKHALEGEISSSQQYILTGYLVKYIEHASTNRRLIKNPFNLSRRIETDNCPDMVTQINVQTLSPRKNKSVRKGAAKFGYKTPN